MKSILNILLIEDSEQDALLVMRELDKMAENSAFERVDSADGLTAALGVKEWDLIITDYSMPGFDGITAIKMVRERNEDIPLIIVSGTIGEDVAVKAMKYGATDYIMKDNLTRLNAAVIRELKEAELRKEKRMLSEQLREKEELYRTLVETSPDAIAMIDINGEILFANTKISLILGNHDAGNIIGKKIFEFVEPEEIESLKNTLKDAAINPIKGNIEQRLIRKDGSIINVEVNIGHVYDSPGALKHLILIIRNITERKIAEKKLAASEERYRLLFQSAAEGIVVVDVETRELKIVNDAACRMFEYSEQEMTRMSIKDLHPPESQANIISEFESHAQGNRPPSVDIPCLRKNGTVFYANIFNAVAYIDDRKHNIGFITDVTAQKEAINKTKLLAHAMESVNDCVSITDLNDNLTFVNNAFCKTYGYENDELIGRNIALVRSVNNPADLAKEILSRTLSGGWTGELFNKRENGEEFPCYLSASVIYDDEKNPTGLLGVSSDITGRKAAEESLKKSEGKFRSLAEQSPNMIFINSNGKIAYANAKCSELTGYSKEEFYADDFNFLTLIAPEYQEIIAQNYANQSKGENSTETEYEIITKDKKRINAIIITQSIDYEGGKAILGTVTDITERKKAAEYIINSELQFRSVWENTAEAMRLTKEDGTIVLVNEAFSKLVEIDQSVLAGNSLDVIYKPEKKRHIIKKHKDCFVSRSVEIHIEKKITLWNDREVWLEITNSFLQFEKQPPLLLGIFRNITERKWAEEELHNSEIRMRTLVHTIPDLVMLKDLNGVYLSCNKMFERLFGAKEADIVGKTDYDFVDKELADFFRKNDLLAIEAGKPTSNEEWLTFADDGHRALLETIKTPMFDAAGSPIGVLGIGRDITDHKRMLDELITAKDKAEQMNRVKTNFMNNMSHEMRTPLVAILGYSQFLLSEIRNTDQIEMLSDIENSGQRLLNTINSILDLTRVESDLYKLTLTEVDLVKKTGDALERMSVSAVNKDLYLRIEKKAENVFSMLDTKSFNKIIENLISNAIKYTEKGGITLEVDKYIVEGEKWSVIKVIDTGIGISKTSLNIIFEEFRQASEGLNRQFEGSGLGLTITKKFVDLMNGKIAVESELGKGSTFTVMFKSVDSTSIKNGDEELSRTESKSSNPPLHKNNKPSEYSLLVVDDDKFSKEIIRLFLKDLYRIEFVEKGELAVQLAENNKYDAVLMDINLGIGISGMEAAKRIKKLKEYEEVPIIAVTAYATEGDKELFLNNGCTHYISKPYEKESIIKILRVALNQE